MHTVVFNSFLLKARALYSDAFIYLAMCTVVVLRIVCLLQIISLTHHRFQLSQAAAQWTWLVCLSVQLPAAADVK